MTTFDQVPFNNVEFADNPEPRCACLLLLDTSGSMEGAKIAQLNAGLATFAEQLRADSMASKRVEVAVVTFGPVKVVQNFVTADTYSPVPLRASGNTPIGEAIETAVRLVSERKQAYRANGIGYYRPWIFLISDGEPTDDTAAASLLIRKGESKKSFMFYSVGVENADIGRLAQIAVRQPLRLKGLSFGQLFVWLSDSLSSVSRSQVSDAPELTNPAAPGGWAKAE
ncbi:MAG: VWA domain-containing protein [Steroidobacteraceae bacterium]